MVKKINGPDLVDAAAPAPAGPVQVESLDDLTREAQGMQQGEQADQARAQQSQQQAEAGQRQAQAASAVNDIVQVLRVARNMGANLAEAADVLPKDKVLEIWSDAQLGDLAMPLLAVMERHGGQVNAFLERYGPYVMLIAAAAMPAIATIRAVRDHKAITVPSRVVPAAPRPGEGATGG